MNQIGVQGYTIRDYITTVADFSKTLTRIRDIGYTCLDHGVPQEMTAAEFKLLLGDHGVSPLKVGGDVYKLLENPDQTIADAKALGVDLVAVLSIPKHMRGGEAGYYQFASDLQRVAELLKKEGLRTAYHSHAFEFCSFGGYKGIDILLNETTDVELVPDTHWIAAGGCNPPDFIRRLTGRVSQVHFKDYGIDCGTDILENVPRVYAEVGQGNLNWLEITRACLEIGIRTFLVEQDTCKVDPFTSLAISYKAIKALGL